MGTSHCTYRFSSSSTFSICLEVTIMSWSCSRYITFKVIAFGDCHIVNGWLLACLVDLQDTMHSIIYWKIAVVWSWFIQLFRWQNDIVVGGENIWCGCNRYSSLMKLFWIRWSILGWKFSHHISNACMWWMGWMIPFYLCSLPPLRNQNHCSEKHHRFYFT